MIETDYKHIVLNENNVAMIAGTRTKVIELVLDYQAELDADIERRWQEVKQLQQSRELSPVEKRLKGRKTRE